MTKEQQRKLDRRKQRAREISLARKSTQMNIAAFDQATKCGISFEISGTNEWSVDLWNLEIKSKESQGMKWIRFEAKVRSFLKQHDIKIVAYELPAGRNIKPIIHSAKLIGVIEKVCVELGIEYIEFSASSVKQFATDKGNASKQLMLEYAEKLWGYDGGDDNEADALHILKYLKTKIN